MREAHIIHAVRISFSLECTGAHVPRFLPLNANDKGPLANTISLDIILTNLFQTDSLVNPDSLFTQEPDHESTK
jgi:hypothetical protein